MDVVFEVDGRGFASRGNSLQVDGEIGGGQIDGCEILNFASLGFSSLAWRKFGLKESGSDGGYQ